MKPIRINNIECRKYRTTQTKNKFYEIVKWNDSSYCYTVAWLKNDSESWYLQSVGSRILQLSYDDLKDFIEVYDRANTKLNK